MLYKSLIADKVDVTGRSITGFASIFGNKDSVGDIVCNGSFNKTIAENRRRFRHLWQHNTYEPPTATIRDIQEVDRESLPDVVKVNYPEATGGLMVTREYLETDYCERIYKGILNGAINEMSFMYDIIKSDMMRDDSTQECTYFLRELRLYETSDVNWGANEATEASKSELERLINNAKQFVALKTERTKEGRVLSTANLNRMKNAISILQDILLSAEPIVESTEQESAAQPTDQSLKSSTLEYLKTRIKIAQYELSETL